MAEQPLDSAAVAVAVICRGPFILAVYNPDWGSFTLPMTKRRVWDQDPESGTRYETWIDAAMRAAGEVLGRTLAREEVLPGTFARPDLDSPEPLLELNDFVQGDRTGVVKHYSFTVYGVSLPLDVEPRLAPGVVGEWLHAADFAARRPISQTARKLVEELTSRRLLPKP